MHIKCQNLNLFPSYRMLRSLSLHLFLSEDLRATPQKSLRFWPGNLSPQKSPFLPPLQLLLRELALHLQYFGLFLCCTLKFSKYLTLPSPVISFIFLSCPYLRAHLHFHISPALSVTKDNRMRNLQGILCLCLDTNCQVWHGLFFQCLKILY